MIRFRVRRSGGDAHRMDVRTLAQRRFPGSFVFLLFSILFLACHASVLTSDYGFTDDYADLAEGPSGWHIEKKVLEGRPLFALWSKSIHYAATGVGDLRWVRLAGIFGISLLAYSVFRLFVRSGRRRFQSFCVAAIMCSALPFQVHAAWATAALFPFAAFVSGLAFRLGERASGSTRPREKWPLAAGAVLVLAAALMIYQPVAMFFWVFAAVSLLTPENAQPGDTIRRFGRCCAIGLAGMLLGLAAYGLPNALDPDPPLRTVLQPRELPALMGAFFLEALPNALNFATLSPGRWFLDEGGAVHYRTLDRIFACGVFVAVLGGLVSYFRGSVGERLSKFAVAACLVPLSYAPNLASTSNFAQYTTLASLTSLVVLYTYLAFLGYRRLPGPRPPSALRADVFMGSAAAVCVLAAAINVQDRFVAPQVRELEFMRNQLMAGDLSGVRTIHVIRPRPWTKPFGTFMHREFGYPSSLPEWNPPFMVSLLLREAAPEHARLPVTVAGRNDSPIDPAGAFVVDMRNFKENGEWLLSGDPRVFGLPMIRSDWDVYQDDDLLHYVEEPCTPADREEPFFLHLVPVDTDDLPDHRKPYGFDNLDFSFDTYGVVVGRKCIATVPLPGYAAARVRTGQPGAWEGEFSPVVRREGSNRRAHLRQGP